MSDKPLSIRFGTATLNVRIDGDLINKYTRIIHEQYGHGGIKIDIGRHILQTVSKYDGNLKKLDKFFDSNFIPKPEIDSDADKSILPWLRNQNDERLSLQSSIFYRSYIYSRALRETSPDARLTTRFDFDLLWRRYGR